MSEKNKKNLPIPSSPTSSPEARGTQVLTQYIKEISRYPVLTREEELKWAQLYHDQKDLQALGILIQSNLRFVMKIAIEYSKFGAHLMDLIQEGNTGLLKAIKKFNPYKEVRLITYAVWWIRGAIQEYLLKQHSMMRIGTTARQRKLFYFLKKQNLPEITSTKDIDNLSVKLGISKKEIIEMQKRLISSDLSLDATTSMDSLVEQQMIDVGPLTPDESLDQQKELKKLQESIKTIRKTLNQKELYILDHRTLSDHPKTLQVIGNHFKVTRESIRQTENKLIQKIKAGFKNN